MEAINLPYWPHRHGRQQKQPIALLADRCGAVVGEGREGQGLAADPMSAAKERPQILSSLPKRPMPSL